jgi:hypothetical protein
LTGLGLARTLATLHYLRAPSCPMGQTPQVVKLWREQMEKYGHPHAHIDLPVAKGIYPVRPEGTVPPGYETWVNRQNDRRGALEPGHAGLPPLRGTPDVVIERLKFV